MIRWPIRRSAAEEVAGHPGYWADGDLTQDPPWAQLEWFVRSARVTRVVNSCVYRFLSEPLRSSLQAAMDADMLNPQSFRYVSPFFEQWQWGAEARLCNNDERLPLDFSDLSTNFGGWFERAEPGTVVDELFAFVPIATDAAAYDSANYSPRVAELVIRQRASDLEYGWTVDDDGGGEIVRPNMAVGEVLERTATTLLILWRDLGPTAGELLAYQRAAHELDGDGLRIRWGNLAAALADTAQPTLGTGCNDTDLICYDHVKRDSGLP